MRQTWDYNKRTTLQRSHKSPQFVSKQMSQSQIDIGTKNENGARIGMYVSYIGNYSFLLTITNVRNILYIAHNCYKENLVK